MKLQRKNPIPPGVYWVDIIDKNVANLKNLKGFNAWAKAQAPNVRVLKKEKTVTGSPLDWFRGQRMWTLFRVRAPVPRWPKSVQVGFPIVAKQGKETTAPDTVQKPKSKGVAEYWWDEMSDPAGRGIGSAIGLGLLLWAVSKWS